MAKKAEKDNVGTIEFHNKISPNFRSIHADGAYGGITSKGLINLNFFAERFAIPKSTIFEIDPESNGGIGAKIKDSHDSKTGIVRDYEVGIFLDLETTKKIRNLLDIKISELENILTQTSDQNAAVNLQQ